MLSEQRPTSHKRNSSPVRLLSPKSFSDLHLQHTLSHPPDHVLFPFLHGLEGTNHAQNAFFHSSSSSSSPGTKSYGSPATVNASACYAAKVPQYRGLAWVVCEDDLAGDVGRGGSSSEAALCVLRRRLPHELGDSDDDDDDDDEEAGFSENETDSSSSFDDDSDDDEQAHMHPVAHRTPGIKTAVGLGASMPMSIMMSPSAVSVSMDAGEGGTQDGSSSASSSVSGASFFASSSSSPSTATSVDDMTCSTDKDEVVPDKEEEKEKTKQPTCFSPPLLTSTFRPKELLRRVVRDDDANDAHSKRQARSNRRARRNRDVPEIQEWEFVPARVPDGISLRNFGIQVPTYATLSDIVVYSPLGPTKRAMALADQFRSAMDRKRNERIKRHLDARLAALPIKTGLDVDAEAKKIEQELEDEFLHYNVFVLAANEEQMRAEIPHLVMKIAINPEPSPSAGWEPGEGPERGLVKPSLDTMDMDMDMDEVDPDDVPNTVDFAQREKDEMRDLTRASELISCCHPDEQKDLSGTTTMGHWDPHVGQVFLGNANDVPLVNDHPVPLMHPQQQQHHHDDAKCEDDPFNYRPTNDPASAYGYDICIECHDLAPFPTAAHLRAAEEHLAALEKMWVDKCKTRFANAQQHEFVLPPRPPPNANAVIHFPFPSSPANTQGSITAIMPIIKFIEKCIKPVQVAPTISVEPEASESKQEQQTSSSPRRWSSASAHTSSLFSGIAYAAYAVRTRSFTTPQPSSAFSANQAQDTRSRPLKVLLYSSDGYTESSVPALCLLMAVRGLSLPEAYLELQMTKRRSFFVYQGDLGLLKRMEGRLREERERENMHKESVEGFKRPELPMGAGAAGGQGWGWYRSDVAAAAGYRYTASPQHDHHHHHGGRLAARSVSFAQSPLEGMIEPAMSNVDPSPPPPPRTLAKGRPRANTSPWLPSLIGDHQSWFNDPRFDGSFPSRVLPFLYLGNINHALNAYMLHALGITHVVSVGECALVPPPHMNVGPAHPGGPRTAPSGHYVAGRGPGGQGSLWIEEREGRIKVLDIKGICDDGIDTLEPQLEPICDWMDKARQEGGKVLVHCRVGVSRSATVTIAYVMKHLGISLVDAYLIVRSRRLSVLIQPNMRLLYNLCGWEIKLAKERAQGDEQRLKTELARTLNWPYLAKEVHALNEKYLH